MMGAIARWRALRAAGVLGMNRRNAQFVLPNNPRRYYPRVDDKLVTKRLAAAASIPTPPLFGVITYHHELRHLPALLGRLDEFVLKPARGAQGNGIIVITAVDRGRVRYHKSSGAVLREAQIRQHVSSTISGVFSLRGDLDSCLVEARLVAHPCFEDLARFGIPDVRVVTYRGIPVMAMTRLPTAESDGRANLHQGAIGVGLDIARGRAVHAAQHHTAVVRHVDTGGAILGFEVPFWEDVLLLAARASDISGLGYVGVDVVVDAQHGPVLLELNARPGLAIQVANNEGLLPRLHAADAVPPTALGSPAQRCALARDLFARTPA
jgi:alpha-L-glutamate ligase-like protein